MATIITEFPTKQVRPTKYPYSEWFDGQIRVLTEGEDFKIGVPSFRAALYTASKRENLTLRTRTVVNDGVTSVTVQTVPAKEKAKPTPAKKKTSTSSNKGTAHTSKKAPAKKKVATKAKTKATAK